MNVCLVLAGITLSCHLPAATQPAAVPVDQSAARHPDPLRSRVDADPLAPPQDAWIGEDKLRHLGLSFAATSLAYGAARTALGPGQSRVAAAASAALLGIGKEWLDLRRSGHFSYKDLAWDAAGIALGTALAGAIR